MIIATVATSLCAAAGETPADCAIGEIPEGYQLQAYDDCGVPDRQPHIVKSADTTVHEYSQAAVDADEKARTLVTNPKQVDALYEGLNPNLDYVVAVVYASEPFNNRSQSLWAGSLRLHGAHPLPKGKSERLLFRVPRSETSDGRLSLRFKLEGEVNVVVSAIELWAAAPSPKVLHLDDLNGLAGDIEGKALNLGYEGIADAEVALRHAGDKKVIATAKTGPDGRFAFARNLFEDSMPREALEVVVRCDGSEASRVLAVEDLYFEAVHYRPIPTFVKGVEENRISLDGAWRINAKPGADPHAQALDAPGWGDCQVPGQWRQQGYEVALNQHVAMAREFVVPGEWSGRRIFLRFDAIHAGTRYWLNGKELGYSENLFTPVEWEISGCVKPGETNRLDLDMIVDTLSEKLSYSCGYAFHNLGGIDRSVWVYTLPSINIRGLQLNADLDDRYEHGELHVEAAIDNPDQTASEGLELSTTLYAPDGGPVLLSELNGVGPKAGFDAQPGLMSLSLAARIQTPVQWNAEKPFLYRLVLELKRNGEVTERIERKIGFRRIEIRGAQLYVNGQRVKLAGACHHEMDPLTGRAGTGCHAEEDLALMKQANLNYVRTSHYPPTEELLDAADRLGMYVEVEAPFCWVAPSPDMAHLSQVLTPLSAMIDCCHHHASVILWSLANESNFNRPFEICNELCKKLDPSRPTTFNNPDPSRICDIANLHYPSMPFDDQIKDDPRPVLLGEYFFPICHEQTDVMIDPGLRELWGHGHSDPDSEWGRYCAASFDSSYTHPGEPPGAWSHIYNSERIIGGAIWAALDEPFYFPDGQKAGYAWHHGFWGLLDAWRRPKPEWWLAKMIFSPVWFPMREVEFIPGQEAVHIPVENRYAFTNLKELAFDCQFRGEPLAGAKPMLEVPPGERGELVLPVLPTMNPGEQICIGVSRGSGESVTDAWIRLGKQEAAPSPRPEKGPPSRNDNGNLVLIEAQGLSMVFDRVRGDFNPDDPRHTAAVTAFPQVHVTRFDFGDLAPGPPYAVLPDPASRVVDHVDIGEQPEGLAIEVHDHYADFTGNTRWVIDRDGVGKISYDYKYSGERLSVREAGIRWVLKPECDELAWRRWSEWGDFPGDAICRTAGRAKARRDPSWGDARENEKPAWPWLLDQTPLGTTDFRSIKFNIYEASLGAPDGSGLAIYANADAHVRACLDPKGVLLHVLSQCRLGPLVLNSGDHIQGECVMTLQPAGR